VRVNGIVSYPNGEIVKAYRLLVLILLSGCVFPGNLPTTQKAPNHDLGIVVFGFPENMDIYAQSGSLNAKGEWIPDAVRSGGIIGPPGAKYFVRSMPPTTAKTRQGILYFSLSGRDVFATGCGDSMTIFEVPPGKVVYLGDINLVRVTNGFVPKFPYNFEAAQRFVDANYPALKGLLVPAKFDHAIRGVNLLGAGCPALVP
jgi:hypothetical protein